MPNGIRTTKQERRDESLNSGSSDQSVELVSLVQKHKTLKPLKVVISL